MITISLCMIVKNESSVLGRILEQMSDIADEIIIVDTGSSDNTKEIASHYTSLIFDFPWIQDFSAARNFACSKASMDYWMWLDADDVIRPKHQRKLLELKNTLSPATDVVMMRYLTGFDEQDNVTFSYERERLLKNNRGFVWRGKVHEAVTPGGVILHSDIEIEHRKQKAKDPDRNLTIYESMISNGESLEPRHQFYYGRELYYHDQYKQAISVFEHFLDEEEGWIENKIDACLHLSHCYRALGKKTEAAAALLHSLILDVPRPQICCALGSLMMERQAYRQAIYWYEQALSNPDNEQSGGFFQKDFQDYIPHIQLCVCYDRLGDQERAVEYHKLAMADKPDSPAVKQNQEYFQNLFA